MRLTPAWILGLLVVIAPVTAMYVAAQLPSCPLFDLDTPSCAGGWSYLPVVEFALMSPLIFGTLAVIAARPSSAVGSHIRRALLVLLGGLATWLGILGVVSSARILHIDTTRGLAFFLQDVAMLAIGISGLIGLWLDIQSSSGTRASET